MYILIPTVLTLVTVGYAWLLGYRFASNLFADAKLTYFTIIDNQSEHMQWLSNEHKDQMDRTVKFYTETLLRYEKWFAPLEKPSKKEGNDAEENLS